MRWIKKGLVKIPNIGSWATSHAMVPFPFQLNEKVIRIFSTFQDKQGIGRPGYLDVLVDNPFEVINYSHNPLLDIGAGGCFDDNGLILCSVIKHPNNSLFMYYAGFEISNKIRYRLLTGLAISKDEGNSFERFSSVPILERSSKEMFIRGGPFVIYSDNKFKLWYVAGSDWIDLNGIKSPKYDIRYLESLDGYTWAKNGEVVLSLTKEDEYAFGRPAILKRENDIYRMFYSIRRRSLAAYRMGYAESNDGKKWVRKDEELNLNPTLESFDSEAIMYGCPFEINGELYLFYNGNNFGEKGFAIAILSQE